MPKKSKAKLVKEKRLKIVKWWDILVFYLETQKASLKKWMVHAKNKNKNYHFFIKITRKDSETPDYFFLFFFFTFPNPWCSSKAEINSWAHFILSALGVNCSWTIGIWLGWITCLPTRRLITPETWINNRCSRKMCQTFKDGECLPD